MKRGRGGTSPLQLRSDGICQGGAVRDVQPTSLDQRKISPAQLPQRTVDVCDAKTHSVGKDILSEWERDVIILDMLHDGQSFMEVEE